MIKLVVSAKTKVLRDQIRSGLQTLGYHYLTVFSLEQLRDKLIDTPDIDIVIDHFANLHACKKLVQDHQRVRFIIIDEEPSVERAVRFMQAGVDDYIPSEDLTEARLLQAIDIVLDKPNPRRLDWNGPTVPPPAEPADTEPQPQNILKHYDLELHVDKNQVWHHEQCCNLTPTETRLIQVLIEAKGQTVTYEQLALRAQDLVLNWVAARRTLSAHMSNLRTKLRTLGADDYIDNVHRIGYYMRSLEDTLTHERFKFNTIAQHAADIIVYVDGDDIVRFVSPSVSQQVDRNPEQFIDHHFDRVVETVHEDDKEAFLRAFRDAQYEDQTVTCRGIHPVSGEYIWFEVLFSALDDGSGGTVYIARNIDDRIRMQEQLRLTNDRYRRSVQAGMVGVWESDLISNQFYIDSGYRELFGLHPDAQLTHEQATACVHPEDQEAMLENMWHCIDSGQNFYENKHRVIHNSGQQRWVLARGHIVRDAEGRALRINGTDIDITALKEAEETIAAQAFILESISEAIVLTGADGVIRTWNKGAEKLYGYSKDEAIGQRLTSLLNFSYLRTTQREVSTRVISDGSWSGELVLNHRQGHRLYLYAHLSAMRSKQGKITDTLSIVRDITAEYEAVQELRISEARLRLVTDNLQDIITQTGPSGQYTYVSASAERIIGYSAEELMSLPLDKSIQLIHPEDQHIARAFYDHLRQSEPGQTLTAVLRMRHAAGHYVWLENQSQAIFNPQGELVSLIGSTRDVTDRYQAEMALRQSEAHMRAITDNSDDIILHISMAGDLNYVNQALYQTLGYTLEVGFNFENEGWDDIVHPDDREGLTKWRASMNQEDTTTHTYRVQHRDGHYIWLENKVVVVRNPDTGERESLISIQRNITERYQQTEKNRARARLLDFIDTPIIATDMLGTIEFWNRSATDIFGWTAEEAIGQSFNELFRTVYLTDRSEILKALNRSHTWQGNGFYLHDREGQQITLYAHSSLILDHNHNPIGIVVMYRPDHPAHEAYLMGRMPFVVIEWSEDAECYVSPTVAHFGYAPEDFTDGRMRWHQVIHPDDVGNVVAQLGRARTHGDPIVQLFYRVVCEDGTIRQVYVRSELFYDSSDIVARAFIFDVTDSPILQENERHD